jgi:hypothetical protein
VSQSASGHLSITRPRSTCDPLSWSRGAPVHPHGCMDQAGSQKSGRIRSWGRVGSDSRSSWERDGSLVPWTSTRASVFSTSNRDSPAGNALVSPGPFGGTRSGIGGANRDLAGRCPSSRRFPKPTIPDQDSHKIPLSARSATSDYAYARRLVYSR